MIQKTLFHELTGQDPRTMPVKQKPLLPDTVNYFFNEDGYVMEYYQGSQNKIIALFFGPLELVLPSHVEYSRFELFGEGMAGIFEHGNVLRGLRLHPLIAQMYRAAELAYRKKVAERLYVARQLSAPERFTHLKTTQPWVLDVVAEDDVANYLGVSLGMLKGFRNGSGSESRSLNKD